MHLGMTPDKFPDDIFGEKLTKVKTERLGDHLAGLEREINHHYSSSVV
jgi:hypothetical protein